MWTKRLDDLNQLIKENSERFQAMYRSARATEEEKFLKEKQGLEHRFTSKISKEAESHLADPATQQWVESKLAEIYLDMRKGIVPTIDGKDAPKPRQQAVAEAQRRFLHMFTERRKEELQRIIDKKKQQVERRLQMVYAECKTQEAEFRKQFTSEIYMLNWSIKAQQEAEKSAVMKKVKFDKLVFEAAVPKADTCEHLKSKAWGTLYGCGVRCTQCGKELTSLFKDESQVKGYGSGCDPGFNEALLRHRKDEAAFRFTNSIQLEKVWYIFPNSSY